MLTQTTIDRIVDAANIVDVVSEYVRLRKAGASYKGLCPFHDDTTPSFSVSPSRGLCKCFSCGKGGNSVHFIMEMEQLGYIDALKFLAKKYGIEVEEKEMTTEERQKQSMRESMFAVNEWACRYFHDTLFNTEDGRAIGLAYFRSRGFRDDIIEKFRLGFSLDSWDAMTNAAHRAGYTDENLIRTSLSKQSDKTPGRVYDNYRGRVMFPWFTVGGKVVAFGGRVLDARTKGVSQKYINSSESDIYHKASELYGLFQAKRAIGKEDCVYMVEGYTDVIAMHQCGIENVVANSGTALSTQQIHLLHRFTSNVTLLYDGDNAGIKAALRGTDMFLAAGMNVKILLLPDGDDPDSFSRKHSATEFREYITEHQTDFITFKVNVKLREAGRDPIKKSEAIKSIIESIAVIPEEIVRMAYIHECSELIGMSEEVILRETVKNRKEAYRKLKAEEERLQNLAALEQRRQEGTANAPSPNGAEDTGSNVQAQPQQPTSSTPTAPTSTSAPTSNPAQTTTTAQTSIPAPDGPPADLWADDDIPPFEATQERQQPSSSPIHTINTADQQFYQLERLIMTLVVRYGEQIVTTYTDDSGNETPVALATFVNDELVCDDLSLHTPLYAAMLADVIQHIGTEGFQCSRYLLNSPSAEVSREAADMMSDPYQLSKGQVMAPESELAADRISHLMLDYKWAVIKAELDQCRHDLTRPEVIGDAQAMTETMQRFQQYSMLNRELAKRLGDRIVLRKI